MVPHTTTDKPSPTPLEEDDLPALILEDDGNVYNKDDEKLDYNEEVYAYYGYDDDTPCHEDCADVYEYGRDPFPPSVSPEPEVTNDTNLINNSTPPPSRAVPRRSSLKTAYSETERRQRRASIGYKGEEIKVRLPDHTMVRRRRSIGFCDDDKVEVEPLTNHANKQDLWFQPEESDLIRQKNAYLVQYARQFGMQEIQRQKLHTRGLERHIEAEESQENHEIALDTVLDEQAYQRSQGFYDEETIGESYAHVSSYCQEKALLLAQKDYQAVAHEHSKIRRHMRRASM